MNHIALLEEWEILRRWLPDDLNERARETGFMQLVLELYRLRWQIELAFKRLKSLLAFDHVPKTSGQSAKSWMQAKILTSLMMERVALCGRFFPLGDMTNEQSRAWPVFIEIRDAVQAVLAPPLSLARLIERGPQIARNLRQGSRRRKMQR